MPVSPRKIYFQPTENEKEQRDSKRSLDLKVSRKVLSLLDFLESNFFQESFKKKYSIYLPRLGLCLMIIVITIKKFEKLVKGYKPFKPEILDLLIRAMWLQIIFFRIPGISFISLPACSVIPSCYNTCVILGC